MTLTLFGFILCGEAFANNLSISNVTLTAPSASTGTIKVQFDISWDHSWKNSTNHDGVWVFVKYSADSGVTWHHATLKADTGLPGFSGGSGTGITMSTSDNAGVFISRSATGSGTVSATSVQLVWNYGANSLTSSSTARVQVFGIEMCQIPTSSFYAGNTGTACLKEGSSDTDPLHITSEDNFVFTNISSNGYYYTSGGNSGEDSTGAAFGSGWDFPKGYAAFYLMKYELTQGEYVEFLNTLTRAQQQNRVATSLTAVVSNIYVLSNTTSISVRNTVRCPASGNGTSPPVVFSTTRSDRACNYLSWMDGCAFADWAALRPMTELEFEKACRGPNATNGGIYAWGSAIIFGLSTYYPCFSGSENGTETVVTTNGENSNTGNVAWTGGDAGGPGPVRAGIFAISGYPVVAYGGWPVSSRQQAGAGYYGNMELTGNVDERAVTLGNGTGRAYIATHGDGTLTTTASYEGNATNSDWPGIDGTVSRGVTGATGAGFRGANWTMVSGGYVTDRSLAASTDATRGSTYGFRAARTASAVVAVEMTS